MKWHWRCCSCDSTSVTAMASADNSAGYLCRAAVEPPLKLWSWLSACVWCKHSGRCRLPVVAACPGATPPPQFSSQFWWQHFSSTLTALPTLFTTTAAAAVHSGSGQHSQLTSSSMLCLLRLLCPWPPLPPAYWPGWSVITRAGSTVQQPAAKKRFTAASSDSAGRTVSLPAPMTCHVCPPA